MYFTKKEQVVIIVVVCFIAFLSFFKIFNPDTKTEDIIVDEKDGYEEIEEPTLDKVDDELDTAEDMASIMIHIAGCVERPGILELEAGARVIDAIEKSGGLSPEANIDSINLARKLSDEEKIYIPKEGEEVEEELAQKSGDLDTSQPNSEVNINTSSREELMTLPGIGEKTADKILDYREEALFKTIEDIKKVSGIGEKKFEAIKDMIKVN